MNNLDEDSLVFSVTYENYIKNIKQDKQNKTLGEWLIKDEMIASKCGWTPFNNYKVKGFPVATIVNGEIVMENNKIASPAKGKPLNFN